MIPAAAHAAAVPVSDDRARMRAACAAAGGPGTKEGWAILWREGMTMWDLKGPTPVLYDELTRAVCEGRVQLEQPVLVPGCGSGYDVKGLAEAGFRRVVGMDIAEEAIAAARGVLGSGAAATLLCGDFFTDSRVAPGGFKLVFDYTFFCGLPPSLRAAWGQRTAELLAPGGLLLTLAFPLASDELAADPQAPGPPHPVSLQAYRAALEPHGLVIESGPRVNPLSVRQTEQVIWWRKAGGSQ